jgi:hypothetical protein
VEELEEWKSKFEVRLGREASIGTFPLLFQFFHFSSFPLRAKRVCYRI